MEKNNLDKKILDQIKEKDMAPKPKWHFLLKNYLVWILGGLSLVIGSLAVSVIIYVLKYSNWLMHKEMNAGVLEFLVLALPYFWIIILAIFVVLAYYNIKHTKKGYKHSLPALFFLSVGLSIILGTLFFSIGLGQAIDDILSEKSPLYTKTFSRHIKFWSCPEKGRIMGLIVANTAEDEYILLDKQKKEWLFYTTLVEYQDIPVHVGKTILSYGKVIDENRFVAAKVLTAGPGRGYFRRPDLQIPKEKLKYFRPKSVLPQDNHKQELKELFEKYPDLKEAIQKNSSENQDKIKDIIKNNPEILLKLNKLDLIPEELLSK